MGEACPATAFEARQPKQGRAKRAIAGETESEEPEAER